MERLFMRIAGLIFCLLLFLLSSLSLAQNAQNNLILFLWNDRLFAQPMLSNQLIANRQFSREELASLPTKGMDVYRFEASPLTESLADGYGFHQGVWSDDRTKFVFLAIAPNSPEYRLFQVENNQLELLLEGQVGIERGYLVPLGWKSTGDLMLLERYSLHTLNELRLWQYSSSSKALSLETVSPLPNLKGNSLSLGDAQVFIGFDTTGVLAYILHLDTGRLSAIPSGFALQEAPSVFETYPIQVIGLAEMSDFQAWLDSQPDLAPSISASSAAPFLYWPLPDYARSITCYPDSEWVSLNFGMECAGLSVPREYQGHEGTDIGGKPEGLALNTPVYAAIQGIVIASNENCPSGDVSCGDAYGNYLLLEHALVNGNNVETWFTGYAHLQTVLVEAHDYVAELGLPIALSGDTGLGGAHLHFELRSPQASSATNWIDPWDNRAGESLWMGGNELPIAAVSAFPPPTLMLCRSIDGNNIRRGPDTSYEAFAKTEGSIEYEVFQIQAVTNGEVNGDWYHIRWAGSEETGWIWSDLLNECGN
jgi:murein DD-endopeptidase MepM/ murein hydrolase activator NlpD